jgi:hypothetical protein
MLMGIGLNFDTHECKFLAAVKIENLTGQYNGEVLKATNLPDGRGVYRTEDGQVFVRNFKNG